MGLLDLFIAASIPVLKVLLITALGSYLTLDHVNILSEDARKHINNVVFYVFNPALVSSSLAGTITYESMVKLWFMPINVLITFLVGSILGWIVIKLTRPPSHLRGLIVGCCAAGNLGNLPLIILPAVCKEKEVHSDLPMSVAPMDWLMLLCQWRSTTESETGGKSFKGESNSGMGDCREPLLSSNDKLALPQTTSEVEVSCTMKERVKSVFKKINLKALFAPSTTGALAGFVIGLVPLIQKSLIGETAPLRVIQDSASLLGDGAIPHRHTDCWSKPSQRSQRFGLVHSDDPLYEFVLLLQFAMPPAMNIGTITQLFGAGESECSVIMLWTYGLASISLTFWSTFFMWLVS
ncbi:hypothetical protein Patl1_09326 [Pistacia atlantica]|uniref:Uncharacterized protein n=1 Tax=Pistacia atlantica TaxID=434234 RepID=A0ACC1AF45_9ROSI|nr:hypothetical protein Patl1_09326 [Pistacia atlantica]